MAIDCSFAISVGCVQPRDMVVLMSSECSILFQDPNGTINCRLDLALASHRSQKTEKRNYWYLSHEQTEDLIR